MTIHNRYKILQICISGGELDKLKTLARIESVCTFSRGRRDYGSGEVDQY